jgi:hypothetical protein
MFRPLTPKTACKDGLPKSFTTLWEINEKGIWTPVGSSWNDLTYKWAHLVIKSLAQGDTDYKLTTMYMEFENVGAPSTLATVPVIGRSEQLEYYDALGVSKDFLRVSLVSTPSISIAAGFESFFEAGEGNVATFFAQSAGSVGILGRTFSDSVNSKVYGSALVATPGGTDRTEDIIFARSYYDGTIVPQQLKAPNTQIGISWTVPFED